MGLMTFIKRSLLALPLAIAFVLTGLLTFGGRFHLRMQHIAGYGFAFYTPWAWLLDHADFGRVRSRWLDSAITYAFVLWIPAILYSTCLWIFLRLLGVGKTWLSPCIDSGQPSTPQTARRILDQK
jgi:hypothetical protein